MPERGVSVVIAVVVVYNALLVIRVDEDRVIFIVDDVGESRVIRADIDAKPVVCFNEIAVVLLYISVVGSLVRKRFPASKLMLAVGCMFLMRRSAH